ncbi:MAG TPA: TonB-dependent receptor [Longimicrobiales bacterium]|nr:TonB-dependent receptor [Longimicrobiales bacterium]
MPIRRVHHAPLLGVLALLAAGAAPAAGQTTGTVLGRVVHDELDTPLPDVTVAVAGLPLRVATAPNGRFVLLAVPVGERSIRIERVGFQPHTLEGVRVMAGTQTDIGTIRLAPAPVALEGVVVRSQRQPMIEPDVVMTHEVVLGRELRELPITEVAEAVELVTGVSDGHFRGGRVGQEVYVVDGVELKNQLEASTQGFGIEFSPTALEEVDVVTGGFGAEFGSALSGVVRYATRRGNPERWDARGSLLTDHWAPAGVFRGFSALSVSAGGPLPFLGRGATVFADLLAQGMLDSDPRARGATCLEGEVLPPALAQEWERLRESPLTGHLVCPYRSDLLPHQRGEKLIGFLRMDQPLGNGINLTGSVLRNREQRLLYTPEYKYNRESQLGQRTTGTLGILSMDWVRPSGGHAFHVTARGVAMRLDRHLGAVALEALEERATVAGFGLGAWPLLGEEFVRRPIDAQLAEGAAVPGYRAPGGSTGSPFGPAAEGVFFTEGTPDLAAWSRSDMVGADVVAELVSSAGNSLRAGSFTKSYRVENYERVLAHLAGSTPNYARFFPASVSGFLEARLAAADEVIVQLGLRLDAFRPGLQVRRDRADFLAPVIDTEWQTHFGPRIAVAAPVPGTDRRSAVRFSYGLVSQPPDFRYFLDTTLGDSLRTGIRRQGNPNLAFERGSAWEVGVEHLVADSVALRLTGFRKELGNLVTGSIRFQGSSAAEFTTGDFGEVKGVELALRARRGPLALRGGYAWQKALGVVSGALDDTLVSADGGRILVPLAFDRRHALDAALLAGGAAGDPVTAWSAALVASARSGYPLDRFLDPGDAPAPLQATLYLPWTSTLNLRVARRFASLPGCGRCGWRVVGEGRNILDRENVIALRRDTGTLAPSEAALQPYLEGSIAEPIPLESPRYSRLADLDGDGLITAGEYAQARLAAALDLHDPSLFYGEGRQLRLGVEVVF